MEVELWNKLVDLAKSKKDGVYSKEGWHYFVEDGNIGYFGNKSVGIFYSYDFFKTTIWEFDSTQDKHEQFKLYDLKIKELKKKEGLK